MADDSTIIIKKIKKGGGGHHGGAWKVAYADFVTAMMAFFLLLWLLNATEAEQLAGLADYFAPTIGVKDNMGIGFRGGKAALSRGIGADRSTNRGIVFGGVPTGPIVKVTEKFEVVTNQDDAEKIILMIGENSDSEKEMDKKTYSEVAQALENFINESSSESEQQNFTVEETSRGLEIKIKGTENKKMFVKGTSELTDNLKKALAKLSNLLVKLPNAISITGHTSSIPYRDKKNVDSFSNWRISVDRANNTRHFLVSAGVWHEQFSEIIGKSDNDPINYKNPSSEENDRISILLLKESVLPEHKKSAPKSVLIDPDSGDAKEIFEDNDEFEANEVEAEKNIIIEEDDFEKEQEVIESKNPFEGENSAAPENLLQVEPQFIKKEKEKTKPVNSYLFEEKKFQNEEEEELYEGLKVDDPFKSGATVDPFTIDK